MRAKEFLLEYSREKTAQQFGNAIAKRAIEGPDRHWFASDRKFKNPDGSPNLPNILDAILVDLEGADPTPNKIYSPWLAREYAKGNIRRLEDFHGYTDPLEIYNKYKRRGDFPAELKDIMRVPATDFWHGMKAYKPPVDQDAQRGDAKEVFNDDSVRIIVPQDKQAACYYGQGTRWCTAATGSQNYFDRYHRDGPLYILLPKKPTYDGEKYQLHFGTDQFMDEQDDPINLVEILTKRFPGTLEFFKKTEPRLAELIIFAPDEVLQPVIEKVGELSMEIAWDMVQDWESSDEYYHNWQLEQAEERGYVDADGHVDWDRLYEDDDIDYLSYNDEARNFINTAKDSVHLSPQEARQIAADLGEENSEQLPITNYDQVVAASVKDAFGRKGDYGLPENIYKYILVVKTPEGYNVKTVVRQ